MKNTRPDEETFIWSAESVESLALKWQQSAEPYVMVLVRRQSGSTPRLPGSRLVTNGSMFGGTIGGGAVEHKALHAAKDLLNGHERFQEIEIHLVRDLAMCCGGSMSIVLNKIMPKPQLVVFGGGHIGASLARMAGQSTFQVDLVDERPEWTRLSYDVVGVKAHEADPVQFLKSNDMSKHHFFTVATHAHDLDQKIVETLLKKVLQASYIGLVGSRGKWARFQDRLSAKGFDAESLNRVTCPCGIEIHSETPEEIAVSILAEMIKIHRGKS